MGAEDIRTVPQRQHDALEEACRRLLGAGTLPGRAGQPVQLQLQLSLDQLLGGTGTPGRPCLPPGFGQPPSAPPGLHGAAGNRPAGRDGGWPGGPVLPGPHAGPGDDCDAALAPIVTGRVDHDLLDHLAAGLARSWAAYDPARTPCPGSSHPGCAGPHGTGDPGRGPGAATPATMPMPMPVPRTLSSGGWSGRTCPGSRPGGRPAAGRRPAVRARRPRLVAADRAAAQASRVSQPAARRRRRHRPGPAAPAPRHHHPRPALRRPRLRRPARRVPRAPHHPPQPGRHDQPGQLPAAVLLPPPDPDPPVGLDHHPERRRHHHRPKSRRPRPAQPQPTPGRVNAARRIPAHRRPRTAGGRHRVGGGRSGVPAWSTMTPWTQSPCRSG